MADWSETGEAYAGSFAKLCAGAVPALLEAIAGGAAELDGVRLLDVGTGPGTVAAAAAARGATVVGVDPEESMLASARRRHPGIDFVAGLLPELPLPDARFDAVTANFVLSHTPDPAAALRELVRVTVPGGTLAVTVWPPGNSPLRPLWQASLDRSGAGSYPPDPVPGDEPPDRTQSGLLSLMRSAGLQDVTVATVEWVFVIHPDELWLGVEGGVATIGAIHRSLDATGRRTLRGAYLEACAERVDADGLLRLPHSAILARGSAPAA